MGGLAFASIMAKLRKWRVLVLERHFKIGGFTQTFTRPGGTVTSSSYQEERHDGKRTKHHVVDRSRHGVSCCEVLSY
jgi:hypothetical protein